VDPESGDPMPMDAPNEYNTDDILGAAGLFEALGAGLGRGEMADIALAAKRLGQDPRRGVATVRCVENVGERFNRGQTCVF
jgi:radial spoke head protein 4A